MLIYRMDVSSQPEEASMPHGKYAVVDGLAGAFAHFSAWLRNWGWYEALKTFAKIFSGQRVFFGILQGDQIVQSGWANIGFCRYYDVEPNSVVLGSLWTSPELRGKGLAPAAISQTIAHLYRRGYRRFYIDAAEPNVASRRMIAKAGFLERVDASGELLET